MMETRKFLMLAVAVLLAAAPPAALAHGLGMFAYAEGGTVHAEGYYAGGARCRGCTVEVFDEGGRKLLEGRTDAEGRFSFEMPGPRPLKLVLDAGGGHRATYILEEPGREDAPAAAGRPGEPGQEADKTLERMLDEKLRPIKDMLVELNEKASRPGATEIVGGLGWIAGIMGIIAYIKSRRGTK